ncbi:hypothetical protein [Sphingobium sp. CFD-1]|uniref:hypothetical protein n=1 Tax=Sphingobium sp. CFD-1 TaxID=2878545 RepID=UPI00214C608C|nr:hypothetical protein [Sphingobium sp. CFD-1]
MTLGHDKDNKGLDPDTKISFRNMVFRIGSPCGENYGFLVLREYGEVFGYYSDNELFWAQDGNELAFISSSGLISSRYNSLGNGMIWIGRHERRLYPMYLIPVLSYRPINAASHLPPAVINSIPKSGTHLCEKILLELGFESGATMFTWEDVVDDFQHEDTLELEDKEGSRGKICPLQVAVGAIPNGTVVMAHASSPSWIVSAFEAGTRHVHCIRNLRDVLISLYRWKRRGANCSHDLGDFLEFLRSEAEADLTLVERSATAILSHGKGRTVRFEDLASPESAKRGAVVLARAFGLPLEDINAAIARAQGAKTTTYNAVRSDHHTFWNDDVEEFFEHRGLAQLNRKLGYS